MRCWGIKLRTSYTPGDPLHQLSYTASLSGILALACTCNFKMKNALGTAGGPLVPSRAKSPGRRQCLHITRFYRETKVMGTRPLGLVSLKTEYSSRSQSRGNEGPSTRILNAGEARSGDTPAFTHQASPRCQIFAMS